MTYPYLNPGVDVVVVNYRTPTHLLGFCLALIRESLGTPFSLTIVNVAPEREDDEAAQSLDTLARSSGHPCRVLTFEENIGYARACNAGAANPPEEPRPVLVFCNADVVMHQAELGDCKDALLAWEDVGILGPRQSDSNGRLTHAGIFGTNAKPEHRGFHERDRGQYTDVRDAVTVSGAVYFIKRTVWDELTACPDYRKVAPGVEGAFLPTPHYYEETWCSYHARAHGHRVVYWGATTVTHEWHVSSPVGGWAEQQMAASHDIFRDACDHHRIEHD